MQRKLRSEVKAAAPARYCQGSKWVNEIVDSCSCSTAKLDDPAAITRGRPTRRQFFELPHCATLRRNPGAQFTAGLCLTVERLRHRSRASYVANKQNFHFKIAAIIGHAQPISRADVASRFDRLSVGLHSTQLA